MAVEDAAGFGNIMINADFYTPENDIVQVNAQGLHIMLAPAGVPIPLHIARAQGFVKDGQKPGPTETKDAPVVPAQPEPMPAADAASEAARIEAARTLDPTKVVGIPAKKK